MFNRRGTVVQFCRARKGDAPIAAPPSLFPYRTFRRQARRPIPRVWFEDKLVAWSQPRSSPARVRPPADRPRPRTARVPWEGGGRRPPPTRGRGCTHARTRVARKRRALRCAGGESAWARRARKTMGWSDNLWRGRAGLSWARETCGQECGLKNPPANRTQAFPARATRPSGADCAPLWPGAPAAPRAINRRDNKLSLKLTTAGRPFSASPSASPLPLARASRETRETRETREREGERGRESRSRCRTACPQNAV